MTVDRLGAADLFVLWTLRQRPEGGSGCSRYLSTGYRATLGEEHAARALAALESVFRVFAGLGREPLVLLPPGCGFITHDEVRLLTLCCAAQAGHLAYARRQARSLVGPVWSPHLTAALTRLTYILARCSLRLSSNPGAMQRAFH